MLAALLAVAALLLVGGAAPAPAAAQQSGDERLIATELPDSPAGRQMAWFIEASTRLPLGDAEWRAHFAARFLALPGTSPAELDTALGQVIDARGVLLRGVVVAEPDALVALVALPDGRELVITFVVDRAGLVEYATLQLAGSGPEVRLPKPTGSAAVGTDQVQLVDRARAGRRLMLTRWYPAAAGAARRPLAPYASPRLATALGLPAVRAHARDRARPRRGPLPVVLFSPGLGGPRVIYQALAEDLASHGYLVIAVDHTGEAPVEFADGRFALPTLPPRRPIAAAAVTRLADMRLDPAPSAPAAVRPPRRPRAHRRDRALLRRIDRRGADARRAEDPRRGGHGRLDLRRGQPPRGAARVPGHDRRPGARPQSPRHPQALARPAPRPLVRGAGARVLQRPGRHRPWRPRHTGGRGRPATSRSSAPTCARSWTASCAAGAPPCSRARRPAGRRCACATGGRAATDRRVIVIRA